MDDNNESGAPGSEKVMTLKQAYGDFEKHLDFLNITPLERQQNNDVIDIVVEALQMKKLVIEQDHSVTQNLIYPLGKNEEVKKLLFKPRLQARDMTIHLKGVKATDVDGRLMAHVAALCGVNTGILGTLDKADLKVTHSYITFFI